MEKRMKNKKIVKLAVIRDNRDHVCPFGLNISNACKKIGRSVLDMTPVLRVDEDGFDSIMIKDKEMLSEIVKSNLEIMMWSEGDPTPCIFANSTFDNKPKVECNYGDRAAGLGHVSFGPMPSYTQYFSAGYASVPIGFYSDHPIRNQGGVFESMMSSSFACENDEEKIVK